MGLEGTPELVGCVPSRPAGIPTRLERIPSPLTLGGDLGKRRSAQR
jgi:hypothetical protein